MREDEETNIFFVILALFRELSKNVKAQKFEQFQKNFRKTIIYYSPFYSQ